MPDASLLRFRWHIRGQVQGVGFRPFVYRVAKHAGVTGHVFNNATGVHLEIQGSPGAVLKFQAEFERQMPPLARVDSCDRQLIEPRPGEREFTINQSASTAEPADAAVTIDTALCADCLREMQDPRDRRHGHGLINCTNCGPRFSIIRDIPYDRPQTTMAEFAMCPECQREYLDPADRRFHAQPICCPRCGPRVELVLVEPPGEAAEALPKKKRVRSRKHRGNPYLKAAELLLAGKIVAIKGLGGFHLAVRADSEEAVSRLRRLKQRDAKPFALMCRDVEAARALVALSPAGEKELASIRAPIVLAPRVEGSPASHALAPSIAPGTNLLGILLPYTPMHHLLWEALATQAGGKDRTTIDGGAPTASRLPPLVFTSGNVSSEPLVIDNQEALERIGHLCDALLWHNRPIERCVDDSVMLDRGASPRGPLPIRRSRGYAPTPFLITDPLPGSQHVSGLCLGGELKNTLAVVRDGDIILSQHLGDLTHPLAYQYFLKAVDDLVRLFEVRVEFIGHDLHPSYMSTVAAGELARRYGARLIPVQHHLAHAMAVIGEHGLTGKVLALVCDGTGYGADKPASIWGGEVLEIDGIAWRRRGRLRPMRLPGGDAAAKDPRRSAMALLHAVYGSEMPPARLAAERALFPEQSERDLLARMITSGFNSPWTSSTGRLFDAFAALLGICLSNDHEAQAPMALEAAAWSGASGGGAGDALYAVGRGEEVEWELDISPLVKRVVEEKWLGGGGGAGEVARGARLFHEQLAAGYVALLRQVAGAEDVGWGSSGEVQIVASGGTFCNRLMEQEVSQRALEAGFSAFFHELYPPTDGGLAFGQAIFCRAAALTRET